MFRFTQEPSSGSKCQYLAKIIDMGCLSIRTWSVLWRHIRACCACVQCTVQEGTRYTKRMHNRPEYAAIILITFVWTSTVEPYLEF